MSYLVINESHKLKSIVTNTSNFNIALYNLLYLINNYVEVCGSCNIKYQYFYIIYEKNECTINTFNMNLDNIIKKKYYNTNEKTCIPFLLDESVEYMYKILIDNINNIPLIQNISNKGDNKKILTTICSNKDTNINKNINKDTNINKNINKDINKNILNINDTNINNIQTIDDVFTELNELKRLRNLEIVKLDDLKKREQLSLDSISEINSNDSFSKKNIIYETEREIERERIFEADIILYNDFKVVDIEIPILFITKYSIFKYLDLIDKIHISNFYLFTLIYENIKYKRNMLAINENMNDLYNPIYPDTICKIVKEYIDGYNNVLKNNILFEIIHNYIVLYVYDIDTTINLTNNTSYCSINDMLDSVNNSKSCNKITAFQD